MDIYVGNLPYTATEDEISDLFSQFGAVERVKIITDRETGRSKGFAFVTLADEAQLNAAVEALNGHDLGGRTLRVNISEPREQAPRSNFGGGERRTGGYNNDRRGGGGGGDRRGGGGGGFKGRGRRDSYDDNNGGW